jgi:hypothetical protein
MTKYTPKIRRVAPKAANWVRRSPILDQKNVGSCTANAETGLLGTDSLGRTGLMRVTLKADKRSIFKAGTYTLDESFAVKLYQVITRDDDISGAYPQQDTGSDDKGIEGAAAELGLWSGQTTGNTVSALNTALQLGAVGMGSNFYYSMETPDTSGNVTLDKSSGLAGEHEYVISAWDGDRRYRMDNSWNTSWGIYGSAYLDVTVLEDLFDEGAGFMLPAWAAVPTPAPVVDADVLAAYGSLTVWAKRNGA